MTLSASALSSDLKPRVLSGLVLVAIATIDLYLGGSYFIALVAVMTMGMVWECFDLIGVKSPVRRFLATTFSGTAILTLLPALPNGGFSVWVAVSLMFLSVLCALSSGQQKPPISQFGRLLVLLLLNIGCLIFAYAELRNGAFLVLLIPAVVGTDIGAYFTGRLIGGPKLAPRISPNKTWSGAIGGVVAAVIVGEVIYTIMVGEGALNYAPVLAILSVCSQIGDLTESWLKRRVGIKDSGRLIPGHGGLLDRFDGFLGASVMVLGPWFVLTEYGVLTP